MYVLMLFIQILALHQVRLDASESEHFRTFGQANACKSIDAQSRKIYDKAADWVTLITRENILNLPNTFASEINAATLKGQIARITVQTWCDSGQYGAEIIVWNGEPILTYETFGYFEESAPNGAWKNFKGMPAWERRRYFRQGNVVYAESRGVSAPDLQEPPERIEKAIKTLVERVEAQKHKRKK